MLCAENKWDHSVLSDESAWWFVGISYPFLYLLYVLKSSLSTPLRNVGMHDYCVLCSRQHIVFFFVFFFLLFFVAFLILLIKYPNVYMFYTHWSVLSPMCIYFNSHWICLIFSFLFKMNNCEILSACEWVMLGCVLMRGVCFSFCLVSSIFRFESASVHLLALIIPMCRSTCIFYGLDSQVFYTILSVHVDISWREVLINQKICFSSQWSRCPMSPQDVAQSVPYLCTYSLKCAVFCLYIFFSR